jgi:signal transduction histidine kinase
LKARKDGGDLVVEVVDDGLGLPAAAQATIFGMFEQIGGHLSKAQGGLGIGLALVQKLAALHGGRGEAFSAGADQGSTFNVYLPLAAPPDRAGAPPSETGATSADPI